MRTVRLHTNAVEQSIKQDTLTGSNPRGITDHQLGLDLVFLPLRAGSAREFVQSVSRQLPECLTMNVHRCNRRVAVIRQTGLVKSCHRDIFWNATARIEQAFDNANRGEIVYRHDRGGPWT